MKTELVELGKAGNVSAWKKITKIKPLFMLVESQKSNANFIVRTALKRSLNALSTDQLS